MEAALVARMAAGDAGVPVAELYRRYAARLYGLGLRLLGDRDLAEQLVQESFLRLWRTAGRYDEARGAVGAYLFTIARRVAKDLERRSPSRAPKAEVGDDSFGFDDAERIVRQLKIREALDRLSGAHREVLELAHERGLSQHEIAVSLGLPLRTVRTRSYDALRELRATLAELDRGA